MKFITVRHNQASNWYDEKPVRSPQPEIRFGLIFWNSLHREDLDTFVFCAQNDQIVWVENQAVGVMLYDDLEVIVSSALI